jgi:hypothetical protein
MAQTYGCHHLLEDTRQKCPRAIGQPISHGTKSRIQFLTSFIQNIIVAI